MSTPQEHERLNKRVRELETQLAEATARNRRLRTELAQVTRAAQGLSTFGSADAYHAEMQRLRTERAQLNGDCE